MFDKKINRFVFNKTINRFMFNKTISRFMYETAKYLVDYVIIINIAFMCMFL